MEKVLLVDRSETSQVLSVKASGIFLLVLGSGLVGGVPQWSSLVGMGVVLYLIPQTLGFPPWIAVPAQGVSLECQWGKRLLNSFPLLPQGQLPSENLLISEGQIPLHLLPEFQYTFC